MFARKLISLGIVLGVVVVVSGCGGGPGDAPATYKATGVVKYKGASVPKISVAFIPVGGAGVAALGETDAEGKFALTTNGLEGAKDGEYEVSMVPVPEETPDMFAPPQATKPGDGPIPPKYGDVKTSGLKATVTKDPEKNVFTFELN